MIAHPAPAQYIDVEKKRRIMASNGLYRIIRDTRRRGHNSPSWIVEALTGPDVWTEIGRYPRAWQAWGSMGWETPDYRMKRRK